MKVGTETGRKVWGRRCEGCELIARNSRSRVTGKAVTTKKPRGGTRQGLEDDERIGTRHVEIDGFLAVGSSEELLE